MGNVPSAVAPGTGGTGGATISGGPARSVAQHGVFSPSDGFFLMEAAKQGDLDVLTLFLKKNPALVFAVSSSQDRSTAWHFAARVSPLSEESDAGPCAAVSHMCAAMQKAPAEHSVPCAPAQFQEGQLEVLDLLVSVTRQGAVSNTFDPITKVMKL